MNWILGVLITLLVLSAVSKPFVKWFEDDHQNGEPRAHFTSPEAYQNCKGMAHEAKRLGATHWTCHNPNLYGPG